LPHRVNPRFCPSRAPLAEVRKRFLQPPGVARNRIQKRKSNNFLVHRPVHKTPTFMHRSDQLLHSRSIRLVDTDSPSKRQRRLDVIA